MTITHVERAERGAIGSALRDPGALSFLLEHLKPRDFLHDGHRQAWTLIVATASERDAVNATTMFEVSKRRGLAMDMALVVDCVNSTPTGGAASDYVSIMLDGAYRHSLITRVGKFNDEIQAGGAIGAAIMGLVESLLAQTGVLAHEGGEAGSLQTFWSDLARGAERGRSLRGESTGLYGLDELIGGLVGGEVIIIAGRPGQGKSALAQHLAFTQALANRPVQTFSLEMPSHTFLMRQACSMAEVPLHLLRKYECSDADYEAIAHSIGRITMAPVHIHDQSQVSLAQIHQICLRRKARGGLHLVVIDYLQLMRGEGSNREQEIARLSQGIKAMARQLDVPVLLLSQLNRGLENRPDKRPFPSDSRESGAIEQDADIWIGVYRDVVYNDTTEDPDVVELLVRKNRHGPTGTARVCFSADTLGWCDVAGD